MNVAILAALLTLFPGENAVPSEHGQVAAIEATTQSASATITVSAVSTAQTWTNVLQEVVTDHIRYDFAITNWDGNASIATNTLDTFSYSDWMLGTTNMIVGPVRPSTVPVTNTVVAGKAIAASYVVTNTLGTVAVSSHFGTATPENKFFFGDKFVEIGRAHV